jgi:proteasome lid subunit RPN8/RPN11
MLRALVNSAGRLWYDLNRSLSSDHVSARKGSPPLPAAPLKYQPLTRVTLTDEVGRTLFEEYAAHRKGARQEEETGWIILGVREGSEAVVLATLPAGAESQAGVAHVHFNSSAQALGSRIVRQADRRLTILGVVHTHPGTLRHPSDGDFRGDSHWVGQLRGEEGIFGIGTVEDHPMAGTLYARQPRPHMQCMADMCLSWYSLKRGDRHYRTLPYGLTLGPDLARPLHLVWAEIEAHADQLDRLYRQQAGVSVEVVSGNRGPALAVKIPLAEPHDAVRVLLEGKDVSYFVVRHGDLLAVDSRELRIDHGVYLLLAELAAQC